MPYFIEEFHGHVIRTAVRTAQEAGRKLLGKEPFWRHQRQENAMADPTYKSSMSYEVTDETNGSLFFDCKMNWYKQSIANIHAQETALVQSQLDLGKPAAAG